MQRSLSDKENCSVSETPFCGGFAPKLRHGFRT